MSEYAPIGGVLTFLMTDVEGSTRLWEECLPEMASAMRLHDQLAQEITEKFHGRVVKERGEGDALFCVFDRSSDAVLASIEIQRAFSETQWPTPRPIRVRMALHAGETEFRGGDYYGPVINRCARLRGICFGAQVIVSEAVKALCGNLKDIEFLDLGLHRLKDLSSPEQVFQVVAEGLESSFPALLSLGNMPNNLPQHANSFVGRQKESREVREQVEKHRMVTLVGPGGTGKTRLAQHVCEDALERFPDGVWMIELDRLTNADSIPDEIAQIIKVPVPVNGEVLQGLLKFLETKKVLLFLDNCEHMKSEVGALARDLLKSTQNLQILATSREPLGVSGEALYRVPSLGVPPEEALIPSLMREFESVQLFMDRAHAVQQDLVLVESNAHAVGRICRQLDGIPFALELAAARARAMSVEQIADRIEDRFKILGKGDQTRSSRQHTLKALIDWSYDLLSRDEQILLNRLSVFVGGCSLEAAEKVTAFEPLDEYDVLDHLSSLVDKSLVTLDTGLQRYRLLETVRQYGNEKLEADGETEFTLAQHAKFFGDLGKLIRAGLKGNDPKSWSDRIDLDLDNFRLAIRSLEPKDAVGKAQLLIDLFRYFDAQAMFAEPREGLNRVLSRLDETTDAELVGTVHQVLGNLARRQGDFELALTHLEKARQLFAITRNEASEASTLVNLATILMFLGRTEEAEANARPALEVCLRVGDFRTLVTAHLILGNLAAVQRDLSSAQVEFETALKYSKERALPDLQLYAQSNLGLNLSKQGKYGLAIAEFEQLIQLAYRMSVRSLVLDALRFAAQALVRLYRYNSAAELYGLEGFLREKAGVKLSEADDGEVEADLAAIRRALESAEFDAARARFRSMPLEQAISTIIDILGATAAEVRH